MRHQKAVFKTQNKNATKLKLNPTMKKVLVLLIVLFIIIICLLICCNYVENQSKNNNSLLKIPFSNTLYFCPVKSNTNDTSYKKGTMLILSNDKNYNIGQKVFLKNKYPNMQNEAVNQKYLIGIIKEKNNDEYSVLLSAKEKIVEFNKDDVIARVNSSVSFIGYIYTSMLGVQGYIFFGIIPFLFIVLIYFVMKYITISKCLKELNQQSVTNEEPLEIVAQTVRSVSNPKPLFIIDYEEDVKLYKCEKKENLHIQKEKVKDENPIIKRQKKYFKILDKFKMQDSFEKVADSDILLYSKDENTQKKEDDNLKKQEEIKLLTVDDIISEYRKQKPEISNENNESDEKLSNIAKFYYDNNIENYL